MKMWKYENKLYTRVCPNKLSTHFITACFAWFAWLSASKADVAYWNFPVSKSEDTMNYQEISPQEHQ